MKKLTRDDTVHGEYYFLASDVETMLAAQPKQEPVAWALTAELEKRETTTRAHLWFSDPVNCMWTPLYTAPPAQEIVCSTGLCHYRKPLTDAQINEFFKGMEPNNGFWLSFARAIEAAQNIKGDA